MSPGGECGWQPPTDLQGWGRAGAIIPGSHGTPQVLHAARVHIESEFDTICEETLLTDKLHQLEEMCETQGISDGACDTK